MKKIISFSIAACIAFFLSVGAFCGYTFYQVMSGDYSYLKKETIIDILSKETLIFYNDGQTQLGSLFGQEHRIYVPLNEVPMVLRDAIISAEDESFYHNIGIDFKGTLRAAINNLFSRSRQGASTISQQTVKNLYGRTQTNLYTKYMEAINAIKLERLYSKDQILEFYLNQFHVTGNGRGIGIAAKYYFNAEVSDLNLVQAAFIAGSVKGPEKYDPFTKTTKESQEKAMRSAEIRKRYVLGRMLDNAKITKEEYQIAVDTPIPFNQGKFRFNELTVNQLIMRQLSRPEIVSALGAQNSEDIKKMDLRITTTLSKPIHAAAQYGLRQNLSRLHMILEGFRQEPKSSFIPVQKPEKYGFYTARIDAIDRTLGKESLTLSFGVGQCLVSTAALERVALYTDQAFYKGVLAAKLALLRQLEEGQFVMASLKENGDMSSCDLEVRPRIQGGLLVLDKGKIIALAGGFSANEYNRAVFARRQPGSAFKTQSYYGALQLGWSALDQLWNTRDVYTWQGQFYYPNPDHPPTSLEISMLGAGAKSENLASVWIVKHLLDKLTYAQYLELLTALNFAGPWISETATVAKLEGTFKVSANDNVQLRQGILEEKKREFASDVAIIDNPSLKIFINTLHYGVGFEKEEERLQRIIESNNSAVNNNRLVPIQLNLLKNNLLRWQTVAQEAEERMVRLEDLIKNRSSLLESDRVFLSSVSLTVDKKNLIYKSANPWKPHLTTKLLTPFTESILSASELVAFLQENPEVFDFENLLLDGVVPYHLVADINESVEEKFSVLKNQSPLQKLFWHDDCRYSLGTYYLAKMVESTGVQGPLEWVPSFPLGVNVISLSELALSYQTILEGKIYRYFKSDPSNQILLIKRIEDSNGNLLWDAEVEETQIIDKFFTLPILDILRATVTAGTASKLNQSIILRSNNEQLDVELLKEKIRVPNFGKTGTTNDYINGTYVGFLPYPTSKGNEFNMNNAYTIASYVGYDSNEPMTRRGYRVYGGAGAIPAWNEVALAIIKETGFAKNINYQTLLERHIAEIPLKMAPDAISLPVSLYTGLPVKETTLQGDESAEVPVNSYGNDYSDLNKTNVQVNLMGKMVEGGIFIPNRKVSFFKDIGSHETQREE